MNSLYDSVSYRDLLRVRNPGFFSQFKYLYLKPQFAQTYCIGGGGSFAKETAFTNGERSHVFNLYYVPSLATGI